MLTGSTAQFRFGICLLSERSRASCLFAPEGEERLVHIGKEFLFSLFFRFSLYLFLSLSLSTLVLFVTLSLSSLSFLYPPAIVLTPHHSIGTLFPSFIPGATLARSLANSTFPKPIPTHTKAPWSSLVTVCSSTLVKKKTTTCALPADAPNNQKKYSNHHATNSFI